MIAWCERKKISVGLSMSVTLLAIVLGACASWKSVVKSVIDVALAACIAEHPEITDESAMRKVCPYVEEVAPHVREILGARKRGLARMSASPRDAGAE